MYIPLSKNQAKKAFINYIEEELNEEEFHQLLKTLLRNYNAWQDADMAGLFKPYKKQIENTQNSVYLIGNVYGN